MRSGSSMTAALKRENEDGLSIFDGEDDAFESDEALAESDPGPLGSKNNALSTLYYEHNEICELVDESNSFWQSFIFFNYMCHIPCNCYALYNLFFADFDDLLAIVTWTVFLHTILFLAFISLSAADVSAEVITAFLVSSTIIKLLFATGPQSLHSSSHLVSASVAH